MNIKKTALSLLLIMAVSSNQVLASVLGTVKDSSSLDVGKGLTLYQNTFLSEQKGVGNQAEYYCEYTPNSSTVPVVLTGEDIYGRRNAKEIIEYMKNNGMVPMLGINASFFSLQTGIPMGHVITDGIVTSKDDRVLPGIGFRKDGTAFVEDMLIETTAHFGEDYLLQIPHINKYISKETMMLTLFTPDFGEHTGTNTETLNVVLENITDGVRIGDSFKCTVKNILTSAEPVKIEENQFVLSVNTKGNQWAITLINTMAQGDEITVKTTANSEIWIDAHNGLASEGERLLSNGAVAQKLEAGAAPRTAVGITKEGKIIFYVIDGRQTGHSYGAKKETVAKRLLELGCVDAINLDGGGSTTIAGIYPGCDATTIINSPSDGSLRRVTNFIFLKNADKPIGTTAKAYIYPNSARILSGSAVNLSVKTVDENYHTTPVGTVSYNANEFATVDANGTLTALGEGEIEVSAEVDGVKTSAKYKSFITPDDIKLYNAQTGSTLDVIDVAPNDEIYLRADSYYDGVKLVSSNEAYRWTLSDTSNASVSDDGVLKIGENFYADTVLTVKAGGLKKEYTVRLGGSYTNPENYPYSEITVENTTVTVDMFSYNDKISKENSVIKIDGKRLSLSECEVIEIDERHLRVTYNTGKELAGGYHKIFSQVVLENGYASTDTLKIKKNPYENIFADTDTHWAKDTISYMNKMGVVNGSDLDGLTVYRPNDSVTRAEFAIMMCKFLGLEPENYDISVLESFADKDTIPEWAKRYVSAVYQEGIINGKDNNGMLYFEANSKITRAEAVTILSRVLPTKLKMSDITFVDRGQIPQWSYNAFKVLFAQGLITGYEDNTIKPNGNVTRAEAVTMIYNIF